MKPFIRTALALILVVGVAALVLNFYSYLFSRKVIGEIIGVERVTETTAIIGGNVPNNQVFSFAIAIKEKSGEIATASSEDRQWAVAKVGMCVEAQYYPYPPWNLSRSGTYHNARLLKLTECQGSQK